MENITQLDVRFNNKTVRLPVIDEVASVRICYDQTNNIRVRCYPSGHADYEKRDPRSGIFLYQGLASWHLPTGETPAQTIIRIKRGRTITCTETGRRRILDRTLEVPSTIDYEDMGYRFSLDSRVWFIELDQAETI